MATAAVLTLTYDETGPIRKIILDWLSSDLGAGAVTTKKIVGTLIKGVTNPGATAPSDNYNIVITDEEGLNVLANAADDLLLRDTADTECIYFESATGVLPVVCDKLTITIDSAGDAKIGKLILYYAPGAIS